MDLNISKIRKSDPRILVVGSYTSITQSILDFDYLTGRKTPGVVGIIKANKKGERFFFGEEEVLIPYFRNLEETGAALNNSVNFFLNVASARRVLYTTEITINTLPNVIGGVIFAENTPEVHSLKLFSDLKEKNTFIIGPSSVGIMVPGRLKLGAIGGVEPKQILNPVLHESGNLAVFSASGGMTNELLNILASLDKRVSFCLSFGGDRFPVTTPAQGIIAAEKDPETTHIIYFGELGGTDEYEIAELVKTGQVKKPVLAYVAGSIAEIFPHAPQFGHAKALAKSKEESARAKTADMKKAGIRTSSTFTDFVKSIKSIPSKSKTHFMFEKKDKFLRRKRALFATSIAQETESEIFLLGDDQLSLSRNYSFPFLATSLLLGRKIKSKELEEFSDLVMKLLIDNGPSVSGAMNTIITARAGKDMVSALCSGLLAVGKRFGGAVNEAAINWISGVDRNISPEEFVEEFSRESEIIEGIGHKKYRIDNPDPRITELMKWTAKLKEKKYLSFAKEVEKVTSAKKANLILNVDGAMSAILLDILSEKENFSTRELKELTQTEVFNAFFIIPRSVGFIAHYLDQKRLDEGLFRLPPSEMAFLKR